MSSNRSGNGGEVISLVDSDDETNVQAPYSPSGSRKRAREKMLEEQSFALARRLQMKEYRQAQPLPLASKNPRLEEEDQEWQVKRHRWDIRAKSLAVLESGGKLWAMCSAPLLFHFHQYGDGWSCGYRSMQMILASKYACSSDAIVVPSIGRIQRALEQGWREKIDPEGAEHFGYRIFGKKDQVGTSEAWTFLRTCGIHSRAYSFEGPRAGDDVFEFAQEYFSKPSSSSSSPKYPIYLQFDGHAVLLIGVWICHGGVTGKRLLVQDPSLSFQGLKDALGSENLFPISKRVDDYDGQKLQLLVIDNDTLGGCQGQEIKFRDIKK